MRIKIFATCTKHLKCWRFAFYCMKISRSVGWRKKCVTSPALTYKGRVTLHKKKNASNFQTNLILYFWIFLFHLVVRHTLFLDGEKTNNISDKWSYMSFAGKLTLCSVTELMYRLRSKSKTTAGPSLPRMFLGAEFVTRIFWKGTGSVTYFSIMRVSLFFHLV